MGITPIFDEKVLILGDALVIADLHIGIERELRSKGVFIRSKTNSMKSKVIRLLKRFNADRLIILGDLKHSIPTTPYEERSEIKDFVGKLSNYAEVILLKGNHDGNLEKLFQGRQIFKSYFIDDILLTHGHAHVDSLKCRAVIIGHNHPCIEFVDDFGNSTRESAWIKARFNKKAEEFYRVKKAPELIVMPAFSDLISGTPFNTGSREMLGPFFKREFVDIENARAYLLDGTLLGKIKDLR